MLLPVSPEVENPPADLQIVRFVDEANEFHFRERHEGEILVSGSLGAQLVVWEYATAIAGRMLGINPFDQPDVESAKIAARGLLDARPEPTAPAFALEGVEVRVSDPALAASGTVAGVLDALWAQIPEDGYVSIQAYVDRLASRRSSRVCANSSPPTPVDRRRSAGDPGSCTRPGSTTRAVPPSASSCRSSSRPMSTSRSPAVRSRSAS